MKIDQYKPLELTDINYVEKYNLFKGQYVEFQKVSMSAASAVAVGRTSGGLLKEDIKVGNSITFSNNKNVISNIRNIWEENDSLYIQTGTSVYRLVRERDTQATETK